MLKLSLHQLPARTDNYVFLLAHNAEAWVVDPADAPVVHNALLALGLSLRGILLTHHHGDHVGGVPALKAAFPNARVVGHADEQRLPPCQLLVRPGDEVPLWPSITAQVLHVAAHTRTHLAYRVDTRVSDVVQTDHDGVSAAAPALIGRPMLFVGDALFGAGCGRLFEGDAADLLASMRVLSAQPPEALVCCAHEYTRDNLRFAHERFPDHAGIAQRLLAATSHSRPTVPSLLSDEMTTNPYLLALSDEAPLTTVGALRRAKDQWRG